MDLVRNLWPDFCICRYYFMKITHMLRTALLAVTLISAAKAASIAYVSGAGEPWGIGAGDPGSLPAAMDSAFGAGNWDRKDFSDGVSLLSGSYDFLYFDGGDGQTLGFEAYIDANRAALEAFVAGGGRLFLNAARWDDYNDFNLGFGATMHSGGSSSATAAIAHAIFDATTGTSWTGSSFSHDYITGAGLTTLILDDQSRSVLVERTWGSGYVMLGTQTSPYFINYFQANQDESYALRKNELQYAAGALSVPDSGSSAALLLVAGAGLLAIARRRSIA